MQHSPTDRTAPHRMKHRMRYSWQEIADILDEAVFCHVGLIRDGRPIVLPMIHTRIGEKLYLHASSGSGIGLDTADVNRERAVCVTASLLDGIVLARAASHHTVNYRSVIVHGDAHVVTSAEEKKRVCLALVDHALAGRSVDCRPPNNRELAMVTLLSIDLEEASAKVRTGAPGDEEEDVDLPHWSGTISLSTVIETIAPADEVKDGSLPAYLPPTGSKLAQRHQVSSTHAGGNRP